MIKPYINIHTHETNISIPDIIRIKSVSINDDKALLLDDNLFYSLAIHPWDIGINDKKNNAAFYQIKLYSTHKNILAIGETGLDFSRDIPKDTQIRFFKKHINLAKTIAKPLIIHCVRSYSEILQFKKQEKSDCVWIIHGFQGNAKLAQQLIDKNIYLSFGKEFMQKNSKTELSFLSVNLNYTFFETDDENFDIKEVYQKASKLLNIDIQDLRNTIYNNFYKIFGDL